MRWGFLILVAMVALAATAIFLTSTEPEVSRDPVPAPREELPLSPEPDPEPIKMARLPAPDPEPGTTNLERVSRPSEKKEPSEPITLKVEGFVMDSLFVAIPGARVTLYKGGAVLGEALTQGGGFYSITTDKAWKVPLAISAHAPGKSVLMKFIQSPASILPASHLHQDARDPPRKSKHALEWETIPADNWNRHLKVDFKLQTGAILSGSVADGKLGLPDARIYLPLHPWWRDYSPLSFRCKANDPETLAKRSLAVELVTDENGYFETSKIPAGRSFPILIVHPEFMPKVLPARTFERSKPEEFHVVLEPGRILEAEFTLDGEPLRGARVTLEATFSRALIRQLKRYAPGRYRMDSRTVKTTSKGTIHVGSLYPDIRYGIRVDHGGDQFYADPRFLGQRVTRLRCRLRSGLSKFTVTYK